MLFPAEMTKSTGQTPNQGVFPVSCHVNGKVSGQGDSNVNVVLGLLRQESGKEIYGIKLTVDSCDAATGQVSVEIAMLSKP